MILTTQNLSAPTSADVIGLFGVALILAAYFALQTGRADARDWRFSAANALGAALILVSLAFAFNLASAVIETAWLAISGLGLWRAWRDRGER